jgi:hypothetical protein
MPYAIQPSFKAYVQNNKLFVLQKDKTIPFIFTNDALIMLESPHLVIEHHIEYELCPSIHLKYMDDFVL